MVNCSYETYETSAKLLERSEFYNIDAYTDTNSLTIYQTPQHVNCNTSWAATRICCAVHMDISSSVSIKYNLRLELKVR